MEKIRVQARELRVEIEQLQELLKEKEDRLRYLQNKVITKPNYGNLEVIVNQVQEVRTWNEEGLAEGTETVRLIVYLLNKEDYEEHLRLFGSINGRWDERLNSVLYYRDEDNILTHKGGGYILLKDPKLCSDEEWEAIKKGDIPEKFESSILKRR